MYFVYFYVLNGRQFLLKYNQQEFIYEFWKLGQLRQTKIEILELDQTLVEAFIATLGTLATILSRFSFAIYSYTFKHFQVTKISFVTTKIYLHEMWTSNCCFIFNCTLIAFSHLSAAQIDLKLVVSSIWICKSAFTTLFREIKYLKFSNQVSTQQKLSLL